MNRRKRYGWARTIALSLFSEPLPPWLPGWRVAAPVLPLWWPGLCARPPLLPPPDA